MCNLYRLTRPNAEVARWFDAIDQLRGANFAEEIFPGTPGAVIAEGALVAMNWGFPLQRKGAKGQPLKPKPVNNTRADKLDGYFWRFSFEERRCLIPLTAWAEAEGRRGGKTRSWLALPDAPLFVVAGIWRDSDEWGRCYVDGDDRFLRRRGRVPRAHAGVARAGRLRHLDRRRYRSGARAVPPVGGRIAARPHCRAVGRRAGDGRAGAQAALL